MHSDFMKTTEIYNSIDFSSLEISLCGKGRKLHYKKGTKVQPERGEVLIILGGYMTVSRGTHDDPVLGHTFRFMPVGLLERYYIDIGLSYTAEVCVTAIQLTLKEFDLIFLHGRENTKLFCCIMNHMVATLIYAYYERNTSSRYITVRGMLHRYLYKIGNDSINNEGVAVFITKRTGISRSYVYQILSDLKKGGYITMHRGKLISINRDLPDGY